MTLLLLMGLSFCGLLFWFWMLDEHIEPRLRKRRIEKRLIEVDRQIYKETHPELPEKLLEQREREANEALYKEDPSLAIELGYEPPLRIQQQTSQQQRECACGLHRVPPGYGYRCVCGGAPPQQRKN